MLNSINVSLALDPNQELSLDDLDLVLGGSNAVSATGSGEDDQRQQQGSANALDLRTSPVNANVTVTSTETHTGGEGPLKTIADTIYEVGHEAVDLAHKGGEIIYDAVHPIAEAFGQLGHDVIMVIDQHVTGTSPSSGTGH